MSADAQSTTSAKLAACVVVVLLLAVAVWALGWTLLVMAGGSWELTEPFRSYSPSPLLPFCVSVVLAAISGCSFVAMGLLLPLAAARHRGALKLAIRLAKVYASSLGAAFVLGVLFMGGEA